jgi:outer membrane protein assembly factor BamB
MILVIIIVLLLDTYYKNNIYIGTHGQVICFDLDTLAITWKCDLPTGWILLSVGEDTVVVRTPNWIYALEAESGEVQWKVLIDGMSMHAVTEDDVFIRSDDGNLYRIDIESGHIIESYYLGGFLY